MARTSTPDPALAATLRRLREERGITREALAFKTGITTGSLARIELGQSVPGWDTVRLLVKALDITLAELGEAVEGTSKGKS
jgi:transcriptional regulator with XRE-family HTH domain